MYELVEAADQELKARRESQQIYTRRLLRGGFIDHPARPLWRDQRWLPPMAMIITDRTRTTNITMQSAKQEVIGVVNWHG